MADLDYGGEQPPTKKTPNIEDLYSDEEKTPSDELGQKLVR